MSDTAGEPTPPEPVAAQAPAEPVDPGWFNQIPFNPRKGFDSMIPMDLPDRQTRRAANADAADAAEKDG